ncbi:MAG: hypothetical protein QM647_07080 [Asticcacaulis sp.]|uniref:hypothetical protein n=1 Tax=Asticcacaulis sp. TaxID=1872648 RepID=UPI0039E40B8D
MVRSDYGDRISVASFHRRIPEIYPLPHFLLHPVRMSQDDRTAQEHLTPDERRKLLRAFADRMLLRVTAMDDPEDLSGIEKAVRVAAMIERIYSRCDRAERQKTDPRKVEAERATHEEAAIKARVSLASTLKWGDARRRDLGSWWEAAQNVIKTEVEVPARPQEPAVPEVQPAAACLKAALAAQQVTYVDYTEAIEAARAELALQRRAAAKSTQSAAPPFRGPG